MTSMLSTRQGLLTKAGNRLKALLTYQRTLLNTQLQPPMDHDSIKELRRQVRSVRTTVEMELCNVESALDKYNVAADELDPSTPDIHAILQKVTANAESAQELVSNAQDALTTLAKLYEELDVPHENQDAARTSPISAVNLSPIPIPKFSGRRWEWENFWNAFNHSVHSQNIDNLYKMTYLLDALQGEAKESVKMFEVSEMTYPLVINHLKEKYGDNRALVDELLTKLQNCTARSERLLDQQRLCEEVTSIVFQLELKSEHVDNTFLQKQIMAKFSVPVQRAVLRQKQQSAAGTWTTRNLLETVKDHIRAELNIVRQVETTKDDARTTRKHKAMERQELQNSKARRHRATCFYCQKSGHLPKDCEDVRTREKRIEVMKRHNLCLNCGRQGHAAAACSFGACRQCGTHGHHTSICKKLSSSHSSLATEAPQKRPKPSSKTSNEPRKMSAARTHLVSSENAQPDQDLSPDTVLYMKGNSGHSNALLLIGQAQVLNPRTQGLEVVHILLDTGADRSFVSKTLAERLQLEESDSKPLTTTTFGSTTPLKKTCGMTNIRLWDQQGNPHCYLVAKMDILAEPVQRSRLSAEDQKFLIDNDMRLSVNLNTTEVQPQILLGCSDVFTLLDEDVGGIRTLPSGLRVLPSKLGYLVVGQSAQEPNPDSMKAFANTIRSILKKNYEEDSKKATKSRNMSAETKGFSTPIEKTHQETWENFCAFESLGVREFSGPTKEEKKHVNTAVWKHFEETIQRRADGYHVTLPWKENADSLPENKSMAYRRLECTVAKLRRDPQLLDQYHNTFTTQLALGVIEKVDPNAAPDGDRIHYLAHQAVITPHKETTKLRVVFDASAHPRECNSLNDVLHKGPVLLPALFDILLRFRIGKVALVSDVEKAFLQIRLQLRDRDATRMLWLRDVKKPITSDNLVTYRFTRVAFGLNCSPFLLAGTLHHHMNNYVSDKRFAQELQENTYVDNVILTTSLSTTAVEMYHAAKQIFCDINMNLREFRSNCKDVNEKIAALDLSKNPHQKILGIPWQTGNDTLTIVCQYPVKNKCTKRSVSEQISSIYDPHGWLTPLTLTGKIFFQRLWKHDYDWDSPLSMEHRRQWEEIVEKCNGFRSILPRYLADLKQDVRLIFFSDASAQSMAACAYLVQGATSNLLLGKCKLPSIRDTPTIPKLELNSLTLAARLAHSSFGALHCRVNISDIVIFSDSEKALSWIKMTPTSKSAGVLVNNRVNEIKRIVRSLPVTVQFGFINTSNNPADCATRGLGKKEFAHHLWWKGPPFIAEDTQSWPKESRLFSLPDETAEEEAGFVALTTTGTHIGELLDWKRHNDLRKCVATTAYVLRFVAKLVQRVQAELRARIEKRIPELFRTASEPYLTAHEREGALTVLIRNHQSIHLSQQRCTTLKKLKLQEDDSGIFRCRGRMDKADLSFDERQPIFIEAKTPLAEAIVRENHTAFHCGTAHTMSNVRRKFWIPKLRQLVRRLMHRCVPCQKFNNLPFKYPTMDDLPECRVKKSRPFEHTGIDYFGPIVVKNGDGESKVYGVIFTCTTTRLLHLELVGDMSTGTFLQAFRRFIARRGVPSSVISDNAPHFLLAEQILHEATLPIRSDDTVPKTMASEGILWKRITPFAPWQGAFYERLIKTVKHSLYKVVGGGTVTKDTLETLLVEIEGILNSRPLTYQEETFENTPALRPIDFIQRDLIISYPFENVGEDQDDPSYLSPEEKVQLRSRRQAEEALKTSHKLTERYWGIWRQNYLKSLRETHQLQISKQRTGKQTPALGTVVLVSDPVAPRNSWKLGRIIDLKGANGAVREATLKMSSGRTTRRPVNLLVPLELEDDNNVPPPPPSGDSRNNSNLPKHHYNLRPRESKPVRNESRDSTTRHKSATIPTSGFLLALACLLTLVMGVSTQSSTRGSTTTARVRCVQGGADLESHHVQQYELCAENYCITKTNPPTMETVFFPPEVTLHDYSVQWKVFDGQSLRLLDVTCPSAPFCENVRCWWCTANVFNPECSPRAAIIAIASMLYVVITLLYVICYVPVVIGKPCRAVLHIAWWSIKIIRRLIWKLFCRSRRREQQRRADIEALLRAPLLTITLAAAISFTIACQNVDVFSHHTTRCFFSTNGTKRCTMENTEVVKMNSLQQESCIRLLFNNSLVKELRVKWKGIRLTCEKEDAIFTRNTKQQIVDSKRCSDSGSCVGNKCADINTSAVLPELRQGNGYPGITRCVESCGGPGCGCFYLSSGCLFYRIYAVPTDNKIYELFKCPSWKEELLLDVVVRSPSKAENHSIVLQPSTTVKVDTSMITLSSLTIPPIPALSSSFITDGSQIAVWDGKEPTLACDSAEAAAALNCSMTTNCDCQPAENRISCACKDVDITEVFERNIGNRLPIRRPWATLTTSERLPRTVLASISTMTTTELIIEGQIRQNSDCSSRLHLPYQGYNCKRLLSMPSRSCRNGHLFH